MVEGVHAGGELDELVALQQQGQPDAQHVAEQGAHYADDGSLQHEDAADHAFGRAHRHEDGDVVRLFHDQHDQRRDDGEGADQHDHGQEDEHADLFQLESGKKVGVHVHPRAHGRQRAEFLLQGCGHGVGLVDVLDRDLDPGNLIRRQAQQIAGRGKGDETEGRVVFKHPGTENARHPERPDAGLETGGGLLAGGGKQVDAAAYGEAEALGQFLAHEHAGRRAFRGRRELVHAAACEIVEHGQDGRGRVGIDAPQHDAFDPARRGEHPLGVEEGRGAHDAGRGVDAPQYAGDAGSPVLRAGAGPGRRRGQRPQRAGNDDVRIRAENLVADIRREPVVDAEDHHERGHAYGHAEHGHGRNDVDEGLLAPRKEVAQGYEEFKTHRCQHSCLSSGKKITSRMDGESVSSMTRRSMPMPSPAAGGMPYSRARR